MYLSTVTKYLYSTTSHLCQCCIVVMHGCCLMLQENGTQQSFHAVQEPSVDVNVCSKHLWPFILICLPARGCMNGEMHKGIMGYCHIWNECVFIQKGLFFWESKGFVLSAAEAFASQANSKTLKHPWLLLLYWLWLFQEAFEETVRQTSAQLTSSFSESNDLQAVQAGGCWTGSGKKRRRRKRLKHQIQEHLDLLYLPHLHVSKKPTLPILGTFLNTGCFLCNQ